METLLNRTSDPASSPVTLAEAKTQLNVFHNDDDAYISTLILSATAAIEEMTGRPLITQTWALSVKHPHYRVHLPKTPVQSIDSITYYDRDEVQQTALVADFHLFNDIYRAWVEPKDDKDWPDVFDRPDALTISFIAGYGAASDVPVEIKHAILLLLSHWYEQRIPVSDKPMQEMPFAVSSLVGLHKRGWIGA
jgi:uncharacterized phiE125 gp8 family phage protein